MVQTKEMVRARVAEVAVVTVVLVLLVLVILVVQVMVSRCWTGSFRAVCRGCM